MSQVVIQPSFGNPDAWRHWEDTLDKEVEYRVGTHAQALTPPDRAALDRLHPTGAARFWGATRNHDTRMQRLRQGDVVLFTGKKLVRAVGEVGYSFRNATFANTLWAAHAERGSYHNVYSLLSFQTTRIPYEEIWELPGFNTNDNFMGLRFVDEHKGATLMDALQIRTATAESVAAIQELAVEAALASGSSVIDVEAVNVSDTSYLTTGAKVLVHRAEALLVARYRSSRTGVNVDRIRTPVGVTDLYISGPGQVEIIEAKRSADHSFVRQALGQVLDYVLHSPEPVTRLTALFPARPSDEDLNLLHCYGIDCVLE